MESTAGAIKIKRQRSENWLEEDKTILKQLIRERVSIIEDKSNDTSANVKKVAAWRDLLTSFNKIATTPRTVKQAKAQWCIMKMAEKKKKLKETGESLQITGDPSPNVKPTNTDVETSVWLPYEFTVDKIESDSDQQTVEPNCSQTPASLPASPPETPVSKPATKSYRRNRKNLRYNESNHAQKIAENEISCRRELHNLQMAVYNQKLQNLIIKEELIKRKLEYFNKQTDDS